MLKRKRDSNQNRSSHLGTLSRNKRVKEDVFLITSKTCVDFGIEIFDLILQ